MYSYGTVCLFGLVLVYEIIHPYAIGTAYKLALTAGRFFFCMPEDKLDQYLSIALMTGPLLPLAIILLLLEIVVAPEFIQMQ